MSAKRSGKKSRSQSAEFVQKPRGLVHPRVQKVGPEHFGIVSVDCAKARFKWMLADFYGNVLVAPTEVDHNRPELDAPSPSSRPHASSMTSAIALSPSNAPAGITTSAKTRLPRPASKHAPCIPSRPRDSANPRIPTSRPTISIWRPSIALPSTASLWSKRRRSRAGGELQLLVRHRRSLVRNNAALCCQIREHLEAAMPGYAACFDNVFENTARLHLRPPVRLG